MDEIEVTKPKRTRTKPQKDERIIGAHMIEKAAAPAEVQATWLSWYDTHTEKEKSIIRDAMNHIKYSNTGVGYRVFMNTYRAWEQAGVLGPAPKAKF
jgi:hypothetical protein